MQKQGINMATSITTAGGREVLRMCLICGEIMDIAAEEVPDLHECKPARGEI